jgi:hypothetical protein
MVVSEIASQGGELVYYIIGHILVVSSSIHLHTLLLGGGDVDRARQHLLSNFDMLMKLKRYWPVIDAAVSLVISFGERGLNDVPGWKATIVSKSLPSEFA